MLEILSQFSPGVARNLSYRAIFGHKQARGSFIIGGIAKQLVDIVTK
jgi:hypothetical protein